MPHLLYILIPILTIAWTVWGAIEYRRLKVAPQAGDRKALIREYRITIAGEIAFGILSLLAVGVGILHPDAAFHVTLPDSMDGLIIGAMIGTGISFLIGPLMARRGKRPVVLGDVQALLPQTPSERKLFAIVALSAGVCEELLFRGFGLRLFEHAGLTGMTLLVVAAAAFGLAHIYQGVLGVIGTFIMGLVFSLAYLKTGNLLVPIILHTLIDLRILTLPTRRAPQAP